MKVKELMEGKWVAKSLDGKVRRFKDHADAEHWRNNYSGHVTPAKDSGKATRDYFSELDALEAKIKAAKEASKPSLGEIWQKFERAVGDAFPDGDPFDRISHWLNQHNLTIHDVDAAVKHFNGDVDTAHEYLARMWDDYSADAEHDALQGAHGDTYDEDHWFTRANPWK